MLGCTVSEGTGMINTGAAFKNLSEGQKGVRRVRKVIGGFVRYAG